MSKLVFPALTQAAFVKALAGWGMNGGDFFALASETCLSNLGGETAPPSGSLGSMPIFPGVGGSSGTWLLGPPVRRLTGETLFTCGISFALV